MKSVEEPEKFGELTQPKIKIGSGAVVCMATDLLPINTKNWYVLVWELVCSCLDDLISNLIENVEWGYSVYERAKTNSPHSSFTP